MGLGSLVPTKIVEEETNYKNQEARGSKEDY